MKSRFAVSLGIVAAMSMVAAIGFRSALSGWSFVTAAAIGVAGACGVVAFARRRRLLLGESVALSAGAFVVLGGVAVNGLPTPGAYVAFARGMVDGWADLLSTAPPADVTDQLRALPFTIAWLAAAIGGEIARNTRRPGLPAIGPLLALALSLLFTVEERWLALLQGAGILAGTLALIAVGTAPGRRADDPDDLDDGAVTVNRRRLALGAVVAVAAVVAAPLLGPRLPLADAEERFDLRQYQVPPFDPLAVASPLVQLKASLKDERRDDVVFTVSGDAEIDRWPVAVMADYDGVVWTVADPEENEEGTVFVPVDTQLPELDDPPSEGAETVRYRVEIVDLGGSFLPVPGTATELRFPNDRDPRLNLQTGTIALPGGVSDGLTYDLTAAVEPRRSDAELARTTVIPVDRTEELKLLQPPVRNLAADLVEGRDRGWDQLAAIRDEFVGSGFYDATVDTPPGHSEARIATMLEDPAQIVGFEEQYAAAAALMGRVASLPTRVVVGYRIPDDAWRDGQADVTAGDIAAWVELDTIEHGWVPVDVTPDRSRTPDPESQGSTTEQIAIPNPPPPPPPPPEVQPPRQEDEEADDDEAFDPVSGRVQGGGLHAIAIVAIGVAGIPLLLFAAFALVVIAWKAVRRHRRRNAPTTSNRVAGAWAEAIDRCTESGVRRPSGRTPQETVAMYVHDGEASHLRQLEPDLRSLASHVDRAAYAAHPPTEQHASSAWESSDRLGTELRRHRSTRQRLLMRVDPRPLRRDESRAGSTR